MHHVYKYNFRKTSACFVLSGSSVLSIVSDVANKYYLSSIRGYIPLTCQYCLLSDVALIIALLLLGVPSDWLLLLCLCFFLDHVEVIIMEVQ